MIKTEQLYYLIQVAKYNSITLAAKEMFVTKAAVSTAMKQLERECGFEILQRTYRGVKFTVKGEMVLKYAKQILQLCDEIVKVGDDENTCGLSVRKDLYVGKRLMPLLRSKLLASNSGISARYNIHEVKDFDSVKYELDSENLAILLFEKEELLLMAENDQFVTKEIFKSKIYPVSSRGTKLVANDVTRISDEEYTVLPKVVLGDKHQYENVVLYTENNDVYITAILNDLGIGTLTHFSDELFVENKKLFKVYAPLKNRMISIAIVMLAGYDNKRGDFIESVLKTKQ